MVTAEMAARSGERAQELEQTGEDIRKECRGL